MSDSMGARQSYKRSGKAMGSDAGGGKITTPKPYKTGGSVKPSTPKTYKTGGKC